MKRKDPLSKILQAYSRDGLVLFTLNTLILKYAFQLVRVRVNVNSLLETEITLTDFRLEITEERNGRT